MCKVFRRAPIAVLALLWAMPALGDVIDEIAARGTVNIGYRVDAAPFSFLDHANRAAGLSVDLCLRIVDGISKAAKRSLTPNFVEVGTSDRFEALEEKKIDILCGATTVTMKRREVADFTLFTFVTGGSLMVKANTAVPDLTAEPKAKIGVLVNTTSEEALNRLAASGKLNIEVVLVDTHDAAIGLLTSGVLDGYFGDRELLWDLKRRAADPAAFVISDELLTYEPYALAVKRGENRLRLISDQTLAELYRSGEIYRIVERWFPDDEPPNLLNALYSIQSIPE